MAHGTLLIGALALAGLLVAALVLRTRSLLARPGAFECAFRRRNRVAWMGGIAVFGSERLDWYRLVSLSPRPARSWPRTSLVMLERGRRPVGEAVDSVVEVTCECKDRSFRLAMSWRHAAGFTSWLEAAPPGWRTWPG